MAEREAKVNGKEYIIRFEGTDLVVLRRDYIETSGALINALSELTGRKFYRAELIYPNIDEVIDVVKTLGRKWSRRPAWVIFYDAHSNTVLCKASRQYVNPITGQTELATASAFTMSYAMYLATKNANDRLKTLYEIATDPIKVEKYLEAKSAAEKEPEQ